MRIVLLPSVFYGIGLRWKNYKTPIYAAIIPNEVRRVEIVRFTGSVIWNVDTFVLSCTRE